MLSIWGLIHYYQIQEEDFMSTNNIEKSRDKQVKSGSKESVNPDKGEVLKNLEKNKDAAIAHEQHTERPKETAQVKYNDGSRGPSSD